MIEVIFYEQQGRITIKGPRGFFSLPGTYEAWQAKNMAYALDGKLVTR